MGRLAAVCFSATFLEATFFAALAPLLPSLKADLGLSASGAGVLVGSYAAGTLIAALPAGWYAARRGPRETLIVGLTTLALFSIVFGFARNVWLLDIARFIQGVGGGLMWVGAMSWIINGAPQAKRGHYVGLLVAGATVGELCGAPLGALAHALSLELVFSGIAVFAALLLVVSLTESDRRAEHVQSAREAFDAVTGSPLLPAIWLIGAGATAFGLVIVIAPLRFGDIGTGAGVIALAFACGSIIESVLGPLVGHVSDRVGRVWPFRAGMLVGVAALVTVASAASAVGVFSGILIFAFAAGLAFAPALALAADSADHAGVDQGYAASFTNIGWGGGQMVGSVGGGLLAVHGYLLPALVGGTLLLLASLVVGRVAAAEAQPA